MRKYLQSSWMRVVSCIICSISIVSLLIGILGFIFVTQYRDTNGIYESGYSMVAKNYALYAIDMLENGKEVELQKEFEKKKINCSIELLLQVPNENGEAHSTVEKKIAIGEIDTDEMVEIEVAAGSNIRYRENSLLGILLGYSYYHEGSHRIEYPIEKVVFDPADGLFYYQTAVGLYKVVDIKVKDIIDEGYYDYSLKVIDGQQYYYNGYYRKILDTTRYQNWEWVVIDAYSMGLSSVGAWGYQIEVLPEGSIDVEKIRLNGYYINGDVISIENKDTLDLYQVQLSWERDTGEASLFSEWSNLSSALKAFDGYAVQMIVISFALMIISLWLVVCSANDDKERIGIVQKIPVICYTILIGLVVVTILAGAWTLGEWMISLDIGRLSDLVSLSMLVMLTITWLVLSWFQNITTRIKCGCFWKTSEVYYVCQCIMHPFRKMNQLVKANTTLFLQGMLIFGGLAIIEFIFVICCRHNGFIYLYTYILTKPIEIIVIMFLLFQMQQLDEAGKRVAAGDIHNPIDTKKLFWKFKEHGENINKVSEGIQLAVNERMKSEHFKTELITNVSHDIKTPLTSIINYVDLIKKEQIQDEKLQGYVEVLDRQSARLKKLIEDLMEASKASTGNLAVNLEECDVEVLLTQIIGEFEERFQKNQLEVVIDKPDHPVKMMADGRHMWRVIDNLLNNACKYSLPGSRVYISLQQSTNEVVIIFRNISKTALNIPSEELMERFVRGDSSRNTEGSGLGLSIAQSLTELMHGSMKLEIDGDLFKVILKFLS